MLLIINVTFMHVFFIFARLILLFNYIWMSLQSILICKEVLPLCLNFVTGVFIVFFHHDWVYSVKKMSVGGAAIITKLTICHIIFLASKSTIFQKFGCVSLSSDSNIELLSYFFFLFYFIFIIVLP